MANKHFFKPLLPGFHSHLTIPVAFFSKYIQGRNDQKTTAKLRSDASKITWEVKIEDGQRLTDGWKEFALAHDLRVGDILIFRQEKDMAFHVTPLGPSCCEIQYEPPLDDKNNLGKIPKTKKVKKNPRKETEPSSLDPSCFVSNVKPSTLSYDALYFPMSFVRANGLDTRCGEIVLMNEKGTSWTLALKQKQCGTMYMKRGWRSFCGANGLKAGDSFTLKLIQGGRTLALRLSTTKSEEEEEEESSEGDEVESLSTEPESDEEGNLEEIRRKKTVKKNPERETASSSLDPSCFVAKVSHATLRYDKLNLPRSFVRANGVDPRFGEIVLMNEKGTSWTLLLKQEQCGSTYVRRGWRSFCHANGLKAGGFYTFKLIQRGRTQVLSLSSAEFKEEECSEGNEVESFSTEPESDEENNLEVIQRKKKVKKNLERETASSSLDPSCFVAKVTASNLQYDKVNLPSSFVRENGLDTRCGEIVLMNEKGTSWTLNLKPKNSSGTMYIRRGWRSFCSANGLRAGSFFIFKLIQRGRTLALLLSPRESQEADEIVSLPTESDSEEKSNQDEKSVKTRRSMWKGSSSTYQNRFVTLTLTPSNLERSRMFLPVPFTRMHGINEETKMTLLDKNGVKWSTVLRSEKSGDRIRLVGGWKEFFKAKCVKVGESIMFKLLREGDTSCFLKFCCKVKQET